MKIIFATQNPGKLKEIRKILEDFDIEVLSAKDIGIIGDVAEDGATFEENALKKAKFVADISGKWAIADDSGLCIEMLNNAPGVLSARWAGEDASDKEIARYTLSKMENIPEEKRKAWFETALVLLIPNSERHKCFLGKTMGRIAKAPRGNPRPKLPYDVIFIPAGHNRTFAEMSDEEKNSLSSRGIALKKFKDFLKSLR